MSSKTGEIPATMRAPPATVAGGALNYAGIVRDADRRRMTPAWVKGADQVEIPILADVPAGQWEERTDGDMPAGVGMEGYVMVSDPKDGNAFALRVHGDSMSPILSPGDIVIVSPRRRTDLRYPIGVVRMQGGVTLKRVRTKGEVIILESENPMYPPIELPICEVEIIGRVWGWIHMGRE